jgi:hypothetical protein
LLLNALFGWWWADPVAGLVMVPIIAKERCGRTGHKGSRRRFTRLTGPAGRNPHSSRISDNKLVPLALFDRKGIPATKRERIEAAVTAGGRHLNAPYEAWIAADPFRGDVRVIVTGPQGFERQVAFAMNENLICFRTVGSVA